MDREGLKESRHYEASLILQAVSWYLQEMLFERGLEVDHSTLNRWVLTLIAATGAKALVAV